MTEYKDLWGKRLVKYWLRNAQVQVLMILCVLAFYFIWQFVMTSGTTLESALMGMTFMSKFFSAFLIIIWQMTSNKNSFSASLAFGGTRREALLGHQTGLVIEAVQIILLNVIIDIAAEKMDCNIIPAADYVNKVVLMAGIMLISIGIGEMAAVAVAHLGNKGMTVISCLFGFAFALVGGGSVMLGDVLISVNWNYVIRVLFAAGVVIYAAGFIVENRYLKKIQVV